MTALLQCLANISPLFLRFWWLSLWANKSTNCSGVVNTTTHKYDLRRRSINATALALGGFIALAAAGPSVAASLVSPGANRSGWSYFEMPDGKLIVHSGGSVVGSLPAGWNAANSIPSIASNGTNALVVSGKGPLVNASGKEFLVDVAAKIPIGTKAAKVLTAGMKAVPILGTGVALWEVVEEVGYHVSKDPAGDLVVTKTNPNSCPTSSSCTGWYPYYGGESYASPDKALACQAYGASQGAGFKGTIRAVGSGWFCDITRSDGSYVSATSGTMVQKALPGSSGTGDSSTIQDLENAIATKSGWPSSSSISDALVDAIQRTGQTVPLEAPTVTGPATSAGTTTQKTQTTNSGTTTTTTATTNNHTYNDNRVTNTITTTVTVTNNTGTSSTTTTSNPVEETKQECEKNPKAWGCSDLDTPNDEVPKKDKQVTFDPENIGLGNGSCPAPIPVHTSKGDWTLNLGPYCDATVNYVRPVVILFGLFAAFFIAVPGGAKL